ncbi:hypothetical protein AVEN_216754-1 [Araneus ventricosus]|uniref:Uncharacterized protein n=1 Tax=Araneus ventricosus TaxID=182803 RepID=A0A4Y2WRJ3_ARAVE|nr:hypothetical protein AVEN_79045-1 [Araneus ventricosus]GBO38559.1 hypothetical protein AVEN_216754-1 [Araneus ventricosus]
MLGDKGTFRCTEAVLGDNGTFRRPEAVLGDNGTFRRPEAVLGDNGTSNLKTGRMVTFMYEPSCSCWLKNSARGQRDISAPRSSARGQRDKQPKNGTHGHFYV